MTDTYNGHRLYMPISEIRKSYRDSADKDLQVRILADLNLCSRKMIEEITGHKKTAYKKPSWEVVKDLPNERLMELYKAGLTDNKIADETGLTIHKVGAWRWYYNLEANRHRYSKFSGHEARELYDNGYSDAEMAEKLEISASSVLKWRLRNGLKVNKHVKKPDKAETDRGYI